MWPCQRQHLPRWHRDIVFRAVANEQEKEPRIGDIEEGRSTGTAAFSAKSFAFLLLNLVTILWGTQHAVIKSTLLGVPETPGLVNLLRFGLASLLFLPWTPNPGEEENRGLWKAGAELGLWMFLGTSLTA